VGNKAKASAILTIEPRRRKFHKLITLTIPLPGMQTVSSVVCQIQMFALLPESMLTGKTG